MKLNARRAYRALQKIGAPVFERYSDGSQVECGGFKISAEQAGADDWFYPGSKDNAPDGLPWADYWDWGTHNFGVHPLIEGVLQEYGLMSEWEHPGALIVCGD